MNAANSVYRMTALANVTRRQIHNLHAKCKRFGLIAAVNNGCVIKRISTGCVAMGSAARAETTSTTQGLSKLQAEELVLRLTGEERTILMTALREYQSKLVKDEYEGEMVPWCLSCSIV